jgi:hypothetical protein
MKKFLIYALCLSINFTCFSFVFAKTYSCSEIDDEIIRLAEQGQNTTQLDVLNGLKGKVDLFESMKRVNCRSKPEGWGGTISVAIIAIVIAAAAFYFGPGRLYELGCPCFACCRAAQPENDGQPLFAGAPPLPIP